MKVKKDWSDKLGNITPTMKAAAGYCVRIPPRINQIKNYLRTEMNVIKNDLESIKQNNIVEKFQRF